MPIVGVSNLARRSLAVTWSQLWILEDSGVLDPVWLANGFDSFRLGFANQKRGHIAGAIAVLLRGLNFTSEQYDTVVSDGNRTWSSRVLDSLDYKLFREGMNSIVKVMSFLGNWGLIWQNLAHITEAQIFLIQ